MADKQPHLNGAYYGPSAPPPQPPPQPHYRRGRSCCCCLFGFFWKLLLALVLIVGLAALIFWLVVQPRAFKFYVSEANLTQFDISGNTLRYDLLLNFTARNPNKKLSVYYDRVEARAFYEDQRFAADDKVITQMNSFRQYTKSSDPMSAHFSGQHAMVLDSGDLQAQYNEDKTDGAFDIDVKLYFTIRFRLGDVITGDYHPKVKCELKLPLTTNTTTTATSFASNQCDVDF